MDARGADMPSVCFYFQVHQPFRLRRYSIFDKGHNYFDEYKNGEICRKVAHKCYLPANRLMLELVRRLEGRFRLAYSLSGVVLEQFARYTPEVLDSFQELAQTGCVEFLTETYYHSLAFIYSRQEFVEQVRLHQDKIRSLFGRQCNVFRNTELIYNNDLAHFADELGFEGILAEGVDSVLGFVSPNYVFKPPGDVRIRLLLKNYRLSDDIAFRFSNRTWPEWPLTAEKFARWIHQLSGNANTVNLFMDYETLGEHQWASTGIFDFLRDLPGQILRQDGCDFRTPSEVIRSYEPAGTLDFPRMTSWADTERDLSAWLGNAMQSNALHDLYRLEGEVRRRRPAAPSRLAMPPEQRSLLLHVRQVLRRRGRSQVFQSLRLSIRFVH